MDKGSLRHVRQYVNDPFLRPVLDALIFTASPSLAIRARGSIKWVSPLAAAEYKEFADAAFLRECGLDANACAALGSWWPAGGPVWDALGTVGLDGTSTGILLVEAKAHLGELKANDVTRATGDGKAVIERRLKESQEFFKASASLKPWEEAYFQVCNRFAHLYFLNEKLKVPAWLVWLFIVEAPEWPDRATAGQWARRLTEAYTAIGLSPGHPLHERVLVVFAPAAP